MKQLGFFGDEEPKDSDPRPRLYAPLTPRTYTAEDYLQVIADDLYVYDIRNWPNGISAGEVERLYESLEQASAWGFFSSGHALYCLRHLKQQGVPPSRIAEVIESNKRRQLTKLRESWERSLGWYWDCYLNGNDAGWVGRGLEHAEECYKTLCRLHEELKLEPPKRPEWLDYSVEQILKAKSQG